MGDEACSTSIDKLVKKWNEIAEKDSSKEEVYKGKRKQHNASIRKFLSPAVNKVKGSVKKAENKHDKLSLASNSTYKNSQELKGRVRSSRKALQTIVTRSSARLACLFNQLEHQNIVKGISPPVSYNSSPKHQVVTPISSSYASLDNSFESCDSQLESESFEVEKSQASSLQISGVEKITDNMMSISEHQVSPTKAGEDINMGTSNGTAEKEVALEFDFQNIMKMAAEKQVETDNNVQDETIQRNAVGILVVMAMFQKLQEQINLKFRETDSMLTAVQETTKDLDFGSLNSNFQKHEQQFDKVVAELNYFRHKSNVLTEVVQRIHTDMGEITQRLENLEINNAKKCVTLTGLKLTEKREDRIPQVKYFFLEKMGIDADVDDGYPLGGNIMAKTIVIVFQTLEGRNEIFYNKKILSGLLNSEDREYYINEYYPAATNERKRRERDIIKNIDSKVNVEYVKGGLAIAGQIYRKKIIPPTPKDLIELPAERISDILRQRIVQGGTVESKGNKFMGFTTTVTSHQAIRDLYIKLKLVIPDARHIVCAYSIPGEEPYNNDFHDDGEHGAGRVLLELLKTL